MTGNENKVDKHAQGSEGEGEGAAGRVVEVMKGGRPQCVGCGQCSSEKSCGNSSV